MSQIPDNPPLGPELTERLRAISREYCESEGGCHGPDHTDRVHNLALHIGRLMGARLDILSAAALLHDIGRRYETLSQGKICHAMKSAELAEKILTGLGVDSDRRNAILHCIESHRYRNNKTPQSLEAMILFDADKLDSIGAIGIGRAFLFAGQVGARLHNQGVDVDGTSSYSLEDTAYREFLVKLRRIKDLMLTPEGKRLAKERHEFMELFFKRLEKEIHGSPRHDGEESATRPSLVTDHSAGMETGRPHETGKLRVMQGAASKTAMRTSHGPARSPQPAVPCEHLPSLSSHPSMDLKGKTP